MYMNLYRSNTQTWTQLKIKCTKGSKKQKKKTALKEKNQATKISKKKVLQRSDDIIGETWHWQNIYGFKKKNDSNTMNFTN